MSNLKTGGCSFKMDKRFYGVWYTAECPKCGTESEGPDYLSYPKTDRAEPVYFYCEECDEEWTEYVYITIESRPATADEIAKAAS